MHNEAMSAMTPLAQAELDRWRWGGGGSIKHFHSAEPLHGVYLTAQNVNKLRWGVERRKINQQRFEFPDWTYS